MQPTAAASLAEIVAISVTASSESIAAIAAPLAIGVPPPVPPFPPASQLEAISRGILVVF